jgi:hypothetical protein
MALALTLIGIILLFGLYVAWSLYAHMVRAEREVPDPPPPVIDTPETRRAVHEAGHGIVVLRCTLVSEIQHVTIEEVPKSASKNPHISYRIRSEEVPWCALVISLAGMAGEMMAFSTSRSGTSRHDLTEARDAVREILKSPHRLPPWPPLTTPWPDFAAMFSYPLQAEEVAILRAAYAKARAILEEHRGPHGYLTAMLLTCRTVPGSALYQWFGHRGLVTWLGRFTKHLFV